MSAVSRSALNQADFRLGVAAVSSPRLQQALERRHFTAAILGAQKLPEQLLRVAEHALNCQLVALAGQRGRERSSNSA